MFNTLRNIRNCLTLGRRAWVGQAVCGGAVALMVGCTPASPSSAPSASQEEAKEFVKLDNFKAQITRRGQVQEVVKSSTGFLNEDEMQLNLQDLDLEVFKDDKMVANVTCKQGHLWLKENPEQKIGRNDILLSDKVNCLTQDGWVLRSPTMRYVSATSTISSADGYIKQLPLKSGGYCIGRGERFEIKLNLDQNNFESWNEYGKPAVLEIKDQPDLLP